MFPVSTTNQFCRADVPIELWMDSWLAYSRYDAVVVTGDDLATPAASAVQTALWQYAETGGSVLILGTANVPPTWQKRKIDKEGLTIYHAGFGTILVCGDRRSARWPDERLWVVEKAWTDSAGNPWHQMTNATDANRVLRVVEDVGIPVRGLFALMLLFTIAIGPVNLWLLARKGRRLWMLWTVPAISLVTCLAVFGFMLLFEGWQGHLRTEGVTILDEKSQRAASIGWTGFYAPLTPGDGLHFRRDTEAVWQKVENDWRNNGASCTVDWSRDQHFASGWVSARVPSHFKLRKSEHREERLAISRRPDGSLAVVNAFGADIRQLWVADARGQVYTAEEVTVGSPPVTLTPRGDLAAVKEPKTKTPAEEAERNPFRALFQGNTWLSPPSNPAYPSSSGGTKSAFGPTRGGMTVKKTMAAPAAVPSGGGPAGDPVRYLAPGGYVAVLDGAPFFEEGLANAKTRKGKNLVIGILKDFDDAN
jgi:hypothetical protein